MLLVRASSATVERDAKNGNWHVHIIVGAEVIKRPLPKSDQNASDEELRSAAVQTAKDEGYEVDPATIKIVK
jgi:hypothetical protein